MVCRASLEAVFRSWVDFASQELSAVLERVDRCGVLVHEIDLFQGKSLGLLEHARLKLDTMRAVSSIYAYLGYAEVCEDEAHCACAAPNEEDLYFKTGRTWLFVDEIRS